MLSTHFSRTTNGSQTGSSDSKAPTEVSRDATESKSGTERTGLERALNSSGEMVLLVLLPFSKNSLSSFLKSFSFRLPQVMS